MTVEPIDLNGVNIGMIEFTGGTWRATSRVDNERNSFAGKDSAVAWLQKIWSTYHAAKH